MLHLPSFTTKKVFWNIWVPLIITLLRRLVGLTHPIASPFLKKRSLIFAGASSGMKKREEATDPGTLPNTTALLIKRSWLSVPPAGMKVKI
jgi:hypothetical protein